MTFIRYNNVYAFTSNRIYKLYLVLFVTTALLNLISSPAFSQHDYFAPIEFHVEDGHATRDIDGGLQIIFSVGPHNLVDMPQPKLAGDPQVYKTKVVFSLNITVSNTGANDILISSWIFRAICPENNMGLEWQANSSVLLTTPYIPSEEYLLLKPGEHRSFITGEADFYWCLPANQEGLKTLPKYISAVVTCKTLPVVAATNNPPGATNKPNSTAAQNKPDNKEALDPELLDMVKEYQRAVESGDAGKHAQLKQSILSIARQVYQDRLSEIEAILKAADSKPAKSIPPLIAGGGNNTEPGDTNYTRWFFVESDKAMQERFAFVKKDGNMSYYRVQFRIKFDDDIFCRDPDCMGYIFTFGYPDADNQDDIYTHYIFYNSYKGIYTMPDLMPIKTEFPDGSKRYLNKNGIFVYTLANSSQENKANITHSCVDNKLKSTTKCRCAGPFAYKDIFDESKAIILK